MPNYRIDRISEEVRHVLDTLIRQLNDPRIDGTWSVTLKNLPKFKNGKEIEYSILEDTVEGYRKTVTTETDEETGDVTFRVTNATGQGTVTMRGVIKWEDNGDIDAITASTITSRAYTLAVANALAAVAALNTEEQSNE